MTSGGPLGGRFAHFSRKKRGQKNKNNCKTSDKMGPKGGHGVLNVEAKSVDPWSKCILDPVRGIGFTLSPYPLSLLDPLPARCSKTRKNTYKSQKCVFYTCFKSRPSSLWGSFWAFPRVLRCFWHLCIRVATLIQKRGQNRLG